MTIETAVGLFLISMAGNVYQFWAGKKGRDLDAIKKEIELLQQLQATKDKAYEEAKLYQQNQNVVNTEMSAIR